MKRIFAFLCAAAVLAGCGTKPQNGGPTVFQGHFIGYNGEFVEFFLPTDVPGNYEEIPLHVNPDGSFCDTIQFEQNLYDAALFADKFMFRVSVEQGKTYDTEFDITQEGVETNFRFLGEGAAENAFMAHLWAVDQLEAIKDAATFKDNRRQIADAHAPLLKELAQIPNKPFVRYHREQLQGLEKSYAYYYPFCATLLTGTCPDDSDFNAFVGKQKMDDDTFETTLSPVFINAAYLLKGIDVTEALKAAASCSTKPEQKELAMMLMMTQMVNAGNLDGLAEGLEYYEDQVTNEEYLELVEDMCGNALLLTVGTPAPDIEFEDVDGGIHHLSDFVGTPVYVDLWASWCGPCCEEIPYLAKFVESLGKQAEITCISISVDTERGDWTAKLAEVGSAWPQFLATDAGQDSISGQYFVSGIPRFLLIDAEGKIASVNAPRPSTPNLLEELKALL